MVKGGDEFGGYCGHSVKGEWCEGSDGSSRGGGKGLESGFNRRVNKIF